MKKAITVVAVVFCTIIFTSCTDNAKELEENLAVEAALQLIDKDEIQNPRDR